MEFLAGAEKQLLLFELVLFLTLCWLCFQHRVLKSSVWSQHWVQPRRLRSSNICKHLGLASLEVARLTALGCSAREEAPKGLW